MNTLDIEIKNPTDPEHTLQVTVSYDVLSTDPLNIDNLQVTQTHNAKIPLMVLNESLTSHDWNVVEEFIYANHGVV